MAPLVSILIPCYNPGPMLRPCLESCFAQTHPNVEIVLVDNNSADGSPRLAEELGRGQRHKIRIESCAQQGQAFARNRALEFARGAYIQWLDSDDELSPEKIARQVAALEADRAKDAAYSDWEWRFIADGKITRSYGFPLRQHDDLLLSLLVNRWVTPHSYLLRREVALRLRGLGVWRPETKNAADREYFTLAALLGYRFLYVPGCRVFYNGWSTAQITRVQTPADRARAYRDIYAWLREVAKKENAPGLTAEHRRLLDQDWSVYRADPDQLRRTATLNGAERAVMTAAAADRIDRVLEELAAVLAMMMWGELVKDADAQGAPRAAALRRLREWLAMLPAQASDDQREAAALPGAGYPYMAPYFMSERLAILRLLAGLADKGFLIRTAI